MTKTNLGSVYVCVCPTCLRAFVSVYPFSSVPSHTARKAGQVINQSFNLKALMDTILFGVSSRFQKSSRTYLHPEE